MNPILSEVARQANVAPQDEAPLQATVPAFPLMHLPKEVRSIVFSEDNLPDPADIARLTTAYKFKNDELYHGRIRALCALRIRNIHGHSPVLLHSVDEIFKRFEPLSSADQYILLSNIAAKCTVLGHFAYPYLYKKIEKATMPDRDLAWSALAGCVTNIFDMGDILASMSKLPSDRKSVSITALIKRLPSLDQRIEYRVLAWKQCHAITRSCDLDDQCLPIKALVGEIEHRDQMAQLIADSALLPDAKQQAAQLIMISAGMRGMQQHGQETFDDLLTAVRMLPSNHRAPPLIALAHLLSGLNFPGRHHAYDALLGAVSELHEADRSLPITALIRSAATTQRLDDQIAFFERACDLGLGLPSDLCGDSCAEVLIRIWELPWTCRYDALMKVLRALWPEEMIAQYGSLRRDEAISDGPHMLDSVAAHRALIDASMHCPLARRGDIYLSWLARIGDAFPDYEKAALLRHYLRAMHGLSFEGDTRVLLTLIKVHCAARRDRGSSAHVDILMNTLNAVPFSEVTALKVIADYLRSGQNSDVFPGVMMQFFSVWAGLNAPDLERTRAEKYAT